MKAAELWDEQNLLQLIEDKLEENMQLDYKAAAALQKVDGKKLEISKDVSAFANSAGGTIVYGMDESSDEPHYPISLSPIDPKTISKEWLEQVINSRIQPRISGININPVELKSKNPGKFAYVVTIPESDTAHQASDKRYYKRFNFQSVAMEDYEVRQTMNRFRLPAYQVQLRSVVTPKTGETKLRFDGVVENISDMVGHEVSVTLFAPSELIRDPDAYRTVGPGGIEYSRIVSNCPRASVVVGGGVESAHPLTPYSIEFLKSIVFRNDPVPAERFTVFVRVFDRFGLSLTTTFHVRLPSGQVELVNETHAAKRSSGSLLTGQLP